MNMPEIRGQLWEFAFDIQSGSVPVDQRASGKSVSHIVEPGTPAMTLGYGAEAELLGQPRERVAGHAIRYPTTAFGYHSTSLLQMALSRWKVTDLSTARTATSAESFSQMT